VLGIVLAGGTSRRFGTDKRAALLGGRSLLERVVDRALPQVEVLLLNTNDPTSLTLERIADSAAGEGPLCGILSGLSEAQRRGFAYLASFACDTPFFPRDAVARLASALQSSSADYAVASCGVAAHRIFALWPAACRTSLEHAFASGTRSMRDIERWLEPTWADFAKNDGPNGDPFFNINTPADLEAAETWLVAQRGLTNY
jgi:molybdopterin-guanine dinucleotide biosynthesis protein A